MANKSKNKKNKKLLPILLLVLFLVLIGAFCVVNKSGVLAEKVEEIKEKVPILEEIIEEKEEKKLKIINLDSKTRPVAVMINNIKVARPYQSGLQDAFIIYEIIVEGGYTRYMALFKDQNTERIGSVRSSRHYFLDYALENDAVYVHWGWSPEAKSDISRYDVDNINGLTYEGKYFYRDNSLKVGYEHRGFTKMSSINKAIKKLKYSQNTKKENLLNYSIEEIDFSSMEGAVKANSIKIPYSKSTTTSYTYDPETKTYLRFVNGTKHTDYVTKKQYTAKNIITYQVSNHTLRGDVKGRQDIDNVGTGTGYFISSGYAVPIKWSKESRTAQTVYTYMDGTEITVNDGNTFIQIQPKSQKLTIGE